jgi:hypothetical protein
MTTLLPVPFHPDATDDDIIAAIAEHFREAKSAAVPGAFRIVVARLRDRFGCKLVDAAVHRYARDLRLEQQALRRENRELRLAHRKRVFAKNV